MKRLIAKKKSLASLLLALTLVLGLAACDSKDKGESGQDGAQAESSESGADSKKEQDVKKGGTFVFENEGKDFTISIPARFVLAETEVLDDVLKGQIYRFKNGTETLEISDIEFPGVEVNEELIKEEMEMGSGLELTRLDKVEVPGAGTFYGALVHDTSLGFYNFYHRINKGDRIISLLQSRAVPYSVEEEAENKAMLGTLVFK